MKPWSIALAGVLFAVTASAHDLYLVPLKGQRVCARIGEVFPQSTNGITADRVASFRMVGASTKELKGKEEPRAKQFCAPLPAESGVVEMTVFPRFIRLQAKDFNSYINGEQLRQPLAARGGAPANEREGRELYSRYSKALVGQSPNATQPLGHTLEIVPERDPATLKPGEALPVVVLFQGKPLPDVALFAVYAGAKLEGHQYPVEAHTDQAGRASLKLDRPGLWYARLIHMVPTQGDPEIDWRSFFTTLTFEVPAAKQAKQ